MQRRTRDVLIRQRTQIINALRDASGRARVRGGAGQRRGQRIARDRDGRSWKIPRRVVAKVEWHPGELYPRVGFIVTNLSRPAERVVAFYNKRGTCEQWIKQGKGAIKWTRLSCCSFAANAARLQLHALAYNLANFMRTLALPEAIKQWSLTSLREKLVKIGAKVVRHGRYVSLPDGRGRGAEGIVPRDRDSAADRGTTATVATSACVRSPMVMCSRATDGRSASKCQGKWPDQTLDHRPDCQWWRQSSEPRTPLGKTPDIRKNLRQFGSHPGNPGSKLSCA